MKIEENKHRGYTICNEDLIRARILLVEAKAEMYDYLYKKPIKSSK